jgi:UDP-glucuronate decarboxylase
MSKHRVLVLGGAGFIGSHLCDRLIDRGDEVFALDNLQTGSLENIAHLRRHARFDFIEHDVVDAFHVPVDRIYNLACPASPPHYQADPIKTTLTSVLGTLHALKLGKQCGARVLFASTSEVYGDPEVHRQPETYRDCVNTTGPRACYDEGKRCAESLTMDFLRRHGVEVRIARIFNTYGPRMDPEDGRIVSNFVCQALNGEPLTIYGTGTQTRSFCYVDDMVDGLMRLMDHPSLTGPVNLGNPEEFTVIELARLVLELTGKTTLKLVHEPLPDDDPKMRRPVIDLAKTALGFVPRMPLRDGLTRTIAHFERTLRKPRVDASATILVGSSPAASQRRLQANGGR